jgi:cytochrome c-type biogenesis protein CcmH
MSGLQKLLASALLAMTLAFAQRGFAEDPHTGTSEAFDYEHVPGAAELEGKIIAPCCWNQTIDIHGSELSTQLRREIRERLKKGESAEAIEASLVGRYGEKVVAVKRGSRLGSTGVLLAIGMGAAGVLALSMLRRWRDRSTPPASRAGTSSPATTAALDARVDAELAALDRD